MSQSSNSNPKFSYRVLGRVTAVDYYSSLVFYVPFFVVNGVLLRLLIERWRIWRRSKKMFHIAEYDAPEGLTPAYAGLLIDNDIRIEEVVATIYDLDRRGIVTVSDTKLNLLTTDMPVTVPEKHLIDILFSKGNVFMINRPNAMLFLSASDAFKKAMLSDMRARKLLPMPALKTKTSRILVTITFTVASYVSIVLTVFLIKSPMYILAVQHPRYPMSIGQPAVTLLLIMLVITVAFSGIFSNTFTRNGRLNWRFAAGYRLYIATVFKGKFEYGAQAQLTKDMKKTLPYAIAFSIERKPTDSFIRKLGL